MDNSHVDRMLLTHGPNSLSPLPSELRKGLSALTTLGFISFFSCVSLQLLLTWRLIKWTIRGKKPNQCFILISNLIFADIQQSIAFLLNASWLIQDGVITETSNCWAQGWFISTGDLASGVFCFCIGLHTFASVCFDYRLPTSYFILALLGCWTFIYALAVIGVALHPDDVYVRAVAWCWMNAKYHRLRLWLHYFWIFVFEFGTVLIYMLMYVTVQWRIKNNFYSANSANAQHARSVAKLMIVYPIVYIICTLPLATLRMVGMTTNKNLSFGWFAFAGGMISSNGWLDVLLYTITRRIMLFSDDPPSDANGIEHNFTLPFTGGTGKRFGTKTTCEYTGDSEAGHASYIDRVRQSMHKGSAEKARLEQLASFHSTDQLFDPTGKQESSTSPPSRSCASDSPNINFTVKARTTIEVRSDPLVELADLREAQTIRDASNELQAGTSHPISRKSSLEFATKPEGWP